MIGEACLPSLLGAETPRGTEKLRYVCVVLLPCEEMLDSTNTLPPMRARSEDEDMKIPRA